MLACKTQDAWTSFLQFTKKQLTAAAFGNWIAPIRLLQSSDEEISLEIPNVFVKEYLLSNYSKEMKAFLPVRADGELAIHWVVAKREPAAIQKKKELLHRPLISGLDQSQEIRFNHNYRFETFIEGPNNQFVKSAALGVASRPGQSYNPLFIHGGVGLGKTHILHAIGHHIRENSPRLCVQCITAEAFINALIDHVRNKSSTKMKRFYRQSVDVLLLDDIHFLQKLNFEEEFSHTFETLIHQGKQIVITSDKPPAQLDLSERLIARMEWGLIAHLDMPDLETRVAILQHKAELKGIELSHDIAFFIAEHIHNNVRQLEGAVNRLSAHCRLLNSQLTEEMVEKTLKEMFQPASREQVSVEEIIRNVATIFEVRVSDLKGVSRERHIAIPRQVAMFLAKEMINESLTMLSNSFGKKTHSTVVHAHKTIREKLVSNNILRRQINMVRRNLGYQPI